ncbi:MAG: endonuclease V, partial [Candidatus Binatia bacterium]|nr:endonuclease V [Candidatus Binatia bacterium]
MRDRGLHRWDVSPEEAIEIQNRLRAQLDLHSTPERIETVAGIDVSYDRGSDRLFAAIVVLRVHDLSLLDSTSATATVPFPYIPGLLSFRECPAVLQAWEHLRVRPDCLMCDGQGIAHPRRLGIASHLGLWLDIPSIGCAKSLLVGEYREPGVQRGSWEPLYHRG